MSPIIWLNYNFFFFLSLEGFALKLPKGSKREIPKNKGKWRYRRIQCLSIQPLPLQLCVFYTHPKYSVMSPRSLLGQLYHHGWVGVATVFEWISCPGPWERIYTLNNRRWLDTASTRVSRRIPPPKWSIWATRRRLLVDELSRWAAFGRGDLFAHGFLIVVLLPQTST